MAYLDSVQVRIGVWVERLDRDAVGFRPCDGYLSAFLEVVILLDFQTSYTTLNGFSGKQTLGAR